MLSILYEDNHIIVVIKPDGLESQSGKSFAPDMVSEIRKHLASHPQDIHKLTKETSTASKYPQPPYVGVIHRLDRPVSGIMVYAKNPKAAASLSTSLQQGKIEKWYQAVICGKPVDNNGTYVDYLKQDKKNNCSRIVDKSDPESRAGIQSIRLYTNGGKGSPILKSGRNKAAHRQASSDPGSVFRSWNPPLWRWQIRK